jgi:mRNA-degrading endonuclease toxin of MazEF toxin-antitoxin module
MKRGEIWLVGLDPTEGREQKGRRPILIVSPEAFNHVTKVPVVLPITSGGNFARTAGFAVPLTGAGTKTIGVVRCDQPRALDLGARGGKKLESVPGAILDGALAKDGLTHSKIGANLYRAGCLISNPLSFARLNRAYG